MRVRLNPEPVQSCIACTGGSRRTFHQLLPCKSCVDESDHHTLMYVGRAGGGRRRDSEIIVLPVENFKFKSRFKPEALK